ncbi:hypothetical protein B5J94_13315 [Moraxella lacunata]|uniref:Uncharacterized protein n=1 Tax=Moraxella lacunata TaxID=477 RepID=A0A1V4GKS7_MORLA|nr:hypothetical protein B5J94_13315 [Moraxella lacunata]
MINFSKTIIHQIIFLSHLTKKINRLFFYGINGSLYPTKNHECCASFVIHYLQFDDFWCKMSSALPYVGFI